MSILNLSVSLSIESLTLTFSKAKETLEGEGYEKVSVDANKLQNPVSMQLDLFSIKHETVSCK